MRHLLTPAVALAAMLWTLNPAEVSAQGTISTDRPGLAFNPATVSKGTVQFEVGTPAVTLSGEGDVDARLINFPAVLRVGVSEGFEVRVGSTLLNATRVETGSTEVTEDGFGDVELGVKAAVPTGEGLLGGLSLIPSIILPSGDDAFTLGRAGYKLNVAAGWNLTSAFGLTTLTGMVVSPTVDASGNEGYTTSGALVGVVSRSLGARVGSYAEVGYYPSEGEDPAYAGGGLTFLVSPACQLDLSFDRGLTDSAANWLFGAGISLRVH